MYQAIERKMETKKGQDLQRKQVASATNFKLFDYLGGIKDEFKKITWTSRQELINYTKIVISATVIFGMAIYIADILIQRVLTSFNQLIYWIGG